MERWYRHFLLILASSTFCLIPLELVLSGHTEGFWQWVPFGVCALSLLSLILWKMRPSSFSIQLVRGVMVVSCATSLLGAYQHFVHNLEFELEIRPGVTWSGVLWESISGASPLLAPGILFLAGVMVLAALYRWDQSDSVNAESVL